MLGFWVFFFFKLEDAEGSTCDNKQVKVRTLHILSLDRRRNKHVEEKLNIFLISVV